jgi:hypothetical protein
MLVERSSTQRVKTTRSRCKENGPLGHLAKEFWCLMINITCGLMCLLVFMFVVHRMLKWLGLRHWGKQHLKRRHYEDHKWRSTSIKQSPRNEEKCCHWQTVRLRSSDCLVAHWTIRCHTPDCPVHQGTVAQRLVPGGTVEESPDCPVWHQTVRCKGWQRQRSSHRSNG